MPCIIQTPGIHTWTLVDFEDSLRPFYMMGKKRRMDQKKNHLGTNEGKTENALQP